MNTGMWVQLLAVAMIAGAVVSKSSYAVLSRVGARNASGAHSETRHFTGAGGCRLGDATPELATLIDVDQSRIGLALTKDHNVHCTIQAHPTELAALATATHAAIDEDFRERHQWTGTQVILHLET